MFGSYQVQINVIKWEIIVALYFGGITLTGAPWDPVDDPLGLSRHGRSWPQYFDHFSAVWWCRSSMCSLGIELWVLKLSLSGLEFPQYRTWWEAAASYSSLLAPTAHCAIRMLSILGVSQACSAGILLGCNLILKPRSICTPSSIPELAVL